MTHKRVVIFTKKEGYRITNDKRFMGKELAARRINYKKIALFSLFFLMVFQLIPLIQADIQAPTGFNLYFGAGGGFAIQTDDTLLISVSTGNLNGTSATVAAYPRRGQLQFLNQENTTFLISSPDAAGFEVDVTGASEFAHISRFVWRVTATAGATITVVWAWRLQSYVGDYTLIALGVSGVGLMVAMPTWVFLQIRKRGIDEDTIERMAYALLIFCVGFGLMVMWLWSS